MNFFKNKLKTSVIILLLASCHAAKVVIPTEADAQRGAALYPGYDLVTLQKDKILYEQKCVSCHSLQDPRRKSSRSWPNIVSMMVDAAKKNPDKAISEREQIEITRYLVTMSTAKK